MYLKCWFNKKGGLLETVKTNFIIYKKMGKEIIAFDKIEI